jgi:hypothetical protein
MGCHRIAMALSARLVRSERQPVRLVAALHRLGRTHGYKHSACVLTLGHIRQQVNDLSDNVEMGRIAMTECFRLDS